MYIKTILYSNQFRLRKLSLSLRAPDEDRPFLTSNDSTSQQLPSIVVEQAESSTPIDNLELRQRSQSLTNDTNDTTKL